MKKVYYKIFTILTLLIVLTALPAGTVVAAKSVAKIKAKATISAKSGDDSDSSSGNVNILNNTMLSKINGLRESQGVGDLSIDSTLNTYAATRAAEASTTWSHTRPNGSQGVDMIPSNKWRGENLSYYVVHDDFGYTSGEQEEAADVMFDNLVASPTHYDNMVFESFTKIGIRTNVMTTSDGIRLTTAYMFSN